MNAKSSDGTMLMNTQRQFSRIIFASFALTAATVFAFHDFNVQMIKTAHEETSWRHDIYTTADSADLWKSESIWFQKPAVALRLNVTHDERFVRVFSPGGLSFSSNHSDLWSPTLSGGFQTRGGIDV